MSLLVECFVQAIMVASAVTMVFFFGMIKDQDVNGNIKVKVNVDVAWNYNFDADVLEALVWLPDYNVCVAMVPVVF